LTRQSTDFWHIRQKRRRQHRGADIRVAVILVVILTGWFSNAYGQNVALKGIVSRWDNCFLASTQHQFLKDIEAEPNLVAELAFQACSTEEQTLISYLLVNLDQEQVRAIVLKHRNILKQRLVHP
jgi:hypothetical protein